MNLFQHFKQKKSSEPVGKGHAPAHRNTERALYVSMLSILLAKGSLAPGKTSDEIRVDVTLAEDAGEQYQNLELTPTLLVNATQDIEEAPLDFVKVSNEDDLTKAVQQGGKIVLERDITLTQPLTIPEGKSVTFETSGKQITGCAEGCIINKGGLVLMNTDLSLPEDTLSGENAPAVIVNQGTLVISGGTISGRLVNEEAASFQIVAGTFTEDPTALVEAGSHVTPQEPDDGSGVPTCYIVSKN